MALIWRCGDHLYNHNRVNELKKAFDELIFSLKWRPDTKPYTQVGGPVAGPSGICIRNICAMENLRFRVFYRAVRRVFIEVMAD